MNKENQTNPINYYSKTKLIGEKYALKQKAIILRTNFIGRQSTYSKLSLSDWKNLAELVPSGFNKSPNLKRTGRAGIFAGSLELVKEGNISLKQKELFDDIYVKEN